MSDDSDNDEAPDSDNGDSIVAPVINALLCLQRSCAV